MKKNEEKKMSAYDAAVTIMGNEIGAISEIGARYPVFARSVAMSNSEYMLDILKAIPNVTAEEIEKGFGSFGEEKNTTEKKPEKRAAKETSKEEEEEETKEDTTVSYDELSARELYKLCCERGISSKCKKRDKATLIKILKENDGEMEESEPGLDDWEETEKEKEDFSGMKAPELYKLCCERGIKCQKKKAASYYVELLEKDNEEAEEEEETENWEFD